MQTVAHSPETMLRCLMMRPEIVAVDVKMAWTAT
jgi:hypothetical protein